MGTCRAEFQCSAPPAGAARPALVAGTVLILAVFIVTLLATLIPTDPEQEVGAVKISDVQAAVPPGEALDRRVTGPRRGQRPGVPGGP